MIATARGLAILAALAVVLLVVVLVAGPRHHGPIDRSLIPHFDESQVTELEFTRGAQSIRITRGGNQWRWQDPPGIADPATIDGVLTALRGGRWHRRADVSVAGPVRAQLTVGTTTLSVHSELPGTGQTWLVRGHDALLVDNWVASALVPEPLALRQRHPIDCANAKTMVAVINNGTARFAGTKLVEPREMWVDASALQPIYDACARIEIVALGPGTRDNAFGLQLAAEGQISRAGTCEGGRVLVDTSAGAGCVESAPLDTIDKAVREILRLPTESIDRRPLPIEPVKLTLPDGGTLDLAKRPLINDNDADPDRVHELVTMLRTPRERSVYRAYAKPLATIKATDREGTAVELDLLPDHRVARPGEAGAIQLSNEDWDLLMQASERLRDPTRWREDATAVSSFTLDRVAYRRGAVLGEWTRDPPGKVDATLVDALVETLATVRAPPGPPPTTILHRLQITLSPPTGAPVPHTLDLGPQTTEGCAGLVDTVPVVLPLPLCTAAIALAAQR